MKIVIMNVIGGILVVIALIITTITLTVGR